jgi:osmoprotectant transport system ATP-binding protein
MIELKNIKKNFGKTAALKNFSITIRTGKTTILIGPSGCGKSTLIRIITGLINPDSGIVKVEKNKLSVDNLISFRRKIGYVIQEGGLFPHLTAYQNVTIMANFFKWQKEKIEERINTLAELTKFPKEGLNKFPAQLSGGQRQRISLMRALMPDPDYLLLDEPLGALDPLIRYDLQSDLKEIFTKLNKTVLMVTHDLAEAVYLGDELVLMKDGAIAQQGSPKDIMGNPANIFVKKFINAQRSHLEVD